jgi:hypothetical protein
LNSTLGQDRLALAADRQQDDQAKRMEFGSLEQFCATRRGRWGKGPAAVMIAEDGVEIASSLSHLQKLGFRQIFVLAPAGLALPVTDAGDRAQTHVIRTCTRAPGVTQTAVNALIDQMPGEWLYYGYNAEFLFFPFCEDRSIGEMVTWLAGERRQSVLSYVIDLYAPDLTTHPDGVAIDHALLDGAGYYAETRHDAAGQPLERQINVYGGLRWRFEQHIQYPKRRIDRISLFQAQPGLRLRADHTLNLEEMNTYACAWHHSLTVAICSFRVAKALCTNPASRHDITDFRWQNSVPFQWSSRQLLDLGMMEPGQWF